MGKLTEAAGKHKHVKAVFEIGELSFDLLVKIFPQSEYIKIAESMAEHTDEENAVKIAAWFLDADTKEPAVTATELLSEEWSNHDLSKLMNLWKNVNNGIEGN